MSTLSFEDIEAARRRIAGVINQTPVLRWASLDALVGGTVLLKAESLQRTGSFKIRGAFNALAQIPQHHRGGGAVTLSSGNHGLAVATAGNLLGMPVCVLMPADAPLAKRNRAAALGAELVLYDREHDDREALVGRFVQERVATLVPPFEHPHVIAAKAPSAWS